MAQSTRKPVQPDPWLHFLCIDPSETRTGVCHGRVQVAVRLDRLVVIAPGSREILHVSSFASSRDGGFRRAAAEMDGYVPAGVRWAPVIERPPPARFGAKASSIYAFKWWRQWASDLSRARARAAGMRYESVDDAMLDPMPGEWRGPLGLPLRAPPHITDLSERRAWLKERMEVYAAREVIEYGRALDAGPQADWMNDDEAEAVCLFTWAARAVGPVGTWLRPKNQARRLLSIV